MHKCVHLLVLLLIFAVAEIVVTATVDPHRVVHIQAIRIALGDIQHVAMHQAIVIIHIPT
jgi:hypothetical protein